MGGGTDIISGGAGIGLFLLRVHEATGDDKYLTAAVELGDWLVSRSEQDGKGLKWRPTSSMDSYYSGFAHGTAGVAYYLIELFQATQERKYLDAAEGGARWLMDRAKTTGSGLKWSRREPDQKDQYMDGWCNGAAGIGRFFLRLHRVTGRLEYLETAVKAGKWIRLVSYPVDQNRRYNIGSMCCGASGVGDYFLDLYLATGDPGYLEFAAKLGKGIAHVGVTRKDKSKWLHYSDSRGTYYASGFNQGAAGIGYFLLRLYAAQKGLISRMVYFPDSDVFDMWVLK